MATVGAKAKRRAMVEARIADTTKQLADRLQIDVPGAGKPIRDNELAAIVELERQADVLDAILAATVPKPKPKSAGKKAS